MVFVRLVARHGGCLSQEEGTGSSIFKCGWQRKRGGLESFNVLNLHVWIIGHTDRHKRP